jgi:hypothetical protein
MVSLVNKYPIFNDRYFRRTIAEINGALIETDPSIASILAHLLAFFQRAEPVGMYHE